MLTGGFFSAICIRTKKWVEKKVTAVLLYFKTNLTYLIKSHELVDRIKLD